MNVYKREGIMLKLGIFYHTTRRLQKAIFIVSHTEEFVGTLNEKKYIYKYI